MAATCASPPAATLAPSKVAFLPAEMLSEPPVLMLDTTAWLELSLLLPTPTPALKFLSPVLKLKLTSTLLALAWKVFLAASTVTLPPADKLVSPPALICVPCRRKSSWVRMFRPPAEFRLPTTALVPDDWEPLTPTDTSPSASASIEPMVTLAARSAWKLTLLVLLAKVSVAALKSRLLAAMSIPPSPAFRLVPSSEVLPVVLMVILLPEMLAATARVASSLVSSLV